RGGEDLQVGLAVGAQVLNGLIVLVLRDGEGDELLGSRHEIDAPLVEDLEGPVVGGGDLLHRECDLLGAEVVLDGHGSGFRRRGGGGFAVGGGALRVRAGGLRRGGGCRV